MPAAVIDACMAAAQRIQTLETAALYGKAPEAERPVASARKKYLECYWEIRNALLPEAKK